MNFRETTPVFQVKSLYQYDGKAVALDISEDFGREPGTEKIRRIVFNANIHRDISDEKNQQMRINSLLSVLDSCNEDISDFYLLTEKFRSSGS